MQPRKSTRVSKRRLEDTEEDASAAPVAASAAAEAPTRSKRRVKVPSKLQDAEAPAVEKKPSSTRKRAAPAKKAKADTATGKGAKQCVSKDEGAAVPPSSQCGVCFDNIDIQGLLDSCDHAFCFQCITEWSKIENTCPHCKRRFTTLKKVLLSAAPEPPSIKGKGKKAKAKPAKRPVTVKVPRRDQSQSFMPTNVSMADILRSVGLHHGHMADLMPILGFTMMHPSFMMFNPLSYRRAPAPALPRASSSSAAAGGGTSTDPVVIASDSDSDDRAATAPVPSASSNPAAAFAATMASLQRPWAHPLHVNLDDYDEDEDEDYYDDSDEFSDSDSDDHHYCHHCDGYSYTSDESDYY